MSMDAVERELQQRETYHEQRINKHQRWLTRAEHFAMWSKDPSRKVACILVRDQHTVGEGYNGFPHGVNDSDERLLTRATKYDWTIHAEANAVAHAARYGHETAGATAYVTFPPCTTCTTLLIQAGVRLIVVRGLQMGLRTRNGLPLDVSVADEAAFQHWMGQWATSQEILAEACVPVVTLE